VPPSFQCPPDCGWCCTHLTRDVPPEEAAGTRQFRAWMRDLGVYHCTDAVTEGLSLSNAEAARFSALAKERGLRVRLHPRTFLLETRRRQVVTLDWHFRHASCPFYADYQCTIHADRPLVCRAFPVLAPGPRWSLAPQCPEVAPTLARGSLAAALKAESKARRAIEAGHAQVDAAAMRALDLPGARFAKGLAPREAARRARSYRVVALEAILPDEPA